ncbi:MAG TPA: UbiD family decarboxylase domain-containing protein, partial [Caldimonas sp.]|nr:UbiD family decarboxylase domain-containing protein [Caldimonas sp.]
MKYRDLRGFLACLEQTGRLRRVPEPVSVRLDMTAFSDFILRAGGPALLFTSPAGYKFPVLTNLFGTPERVALGMGQPDPSALREVGELLAALKEPEPPGGWRDAGRLVELAKSLWDMQPARVSRPACRDVVLESPDVDLSVLPIQTCWPGDAGPLVTWGLVVTRGPQGVPNARRRQNLGIYRQQLIGRRQLVMRWLAHRGGALDFRDFAA